MAKIPIILEPGRADGKLTTSNSIFDENKGMFQSEINDIQDTLNSDNPNKPLSAKQGKILKELLNAKVIEVGAVPIDTKPTEGNTTHVVNSDGLAKEFNKCKTTIITTDRIEDGAVTTEKIATSAFDSTLSVSGKIAPADIVGEKLTELKEKTSTIYTDYTEEETDSIEFYDKDTLIHKITPTDADFTNLKKEGKSVAAVGDSYTKNESDEKFLTEHQDISGKADKSDVDVLRSKVSTMTAKTTQISSEELESEEDNIVVVNNEDAVIFRIDRESVHIKKLYVNDKEILPLPEPDKPKETCKVVTTCKIGYAAPSDISLGDTLTEDLLVATNGVLTYNVPTNDTVGMWAVCKCSVSNYNYIVVNSENKVIKVGEKGYTGKDIRTYIDLSDVADAKMVYLLQKARNADVFATCVYYDYNKDNYVIHKGETIEGISTLEENDGVFYKDVINNSVDDKIEIQLGKRVIANSVGFWIKSPNIEETEGDKIGRILITLYDGETTVSLNGTSLLNHILYNGMWSYVKIPTLVSGVFGSRVDRIKLSFTFKSGQSTTSHIPILIKKDITINDFNRPVFLVNFDNMWKSTEDCGAYDYLVDNNIPFSITGKFQGTTTISESSISKLANYYHKGYLDIGLYGNEYTNTAQQQDYMVAKGSSFLKLIENIGNCIDDKSANGYKCTSFGAGIHVCTAKMARALKTCGFKAIRYGNPSGTASVISEDKHGVYLGGLGYYESNGTKHLEFYVNSGTCGGLFAHGISNNPSGESDPSLYLNYNIFKDEVDYAIKERAKGGLLIMNMEQYFDYINSLNI